MRHFKLIIFSFVFFTAMCASCKKKEPFSSDVYFSCKINGQLYIPDGCTNCVTCTILSDTTFLLGGNAGFSTVYLGIIKIDKVPIQATSYLLNNNPHQMAAYDNSTLVSDIFQTDLLHTGIVQITTLDKINKLIAGTFSFKAFNIYRTDSVSVTEGKFRWNYKTN